MISIFITSIIIIYLPNFNPSILIKGRSNSFQIEIKKTFNTCEIFFNNNVFIKSYSMYPVLTTKGIGIDINSKKVEQKLNSCIIENLLSAEILKNDYAKQRITLNFNDFNNLKITKIYIDNEKQNLKSFYQNNFFSKNKEFSNRHYITKTISNVLLKFNEPIGNFILTFFSLYTFILINELIIKMWYNWKRSSLEKYINKIYLKYNNIELVKIKLTELYMENEIRYKFLQILGPAMGFLLTISSLIVGLNPIIREVQNLNIFFESIQIAMVSTFIGLIIRIVSIILQKLNNSIFSKIDIIIFNFNTGEKNK